MSIVAAARLSRAPIASLSAIGLIWGTLAASMPDIKAHVGANDAQLGLALIFSSVGAMIAMYVAPRVGKALGGIALPVLGIGLALAFFYPLMAFSPVTLAAAMLFFGGTVAILDITANVQVSALEARHRLHLMNLVHSMFSFSFGAAALVTGFARKAGYSPWTIMPLMAIVAVALALAAWQRAPLAAPVPDGTPPPPPRRTPWEVILLTGAVLFAAFIGENASEAWSAIHIERTLGAPAGEGAFGPFMLGLMMGLGRLSGQFVATRIGEARLILWSAILGVVGALVLAVAPTKLVALIGVGILGLGMAVIVPSVNTILGRLVTEEERSHAMSRAWMAGIVGFFVGPAMIGGISQLVGLRWAFVVVALVVAVCIPAVLRLWRMERAAGQDLP